MASRHYDNNYIIFRPEKISILDILSLFILRRRLTSYKFVETSSSTALELRNATANWNVALFLLIQKLLLDIKTLLKAIGFFVEWTLNLLSLNGGLFGILWHIITRSLVIPKTDAYNYRSIIAHIDGRLDLYKSSTALINYFSPIVSPKAYLSDINFLDLSMMAAKIAYENPAYIENVVNNHWQMQFVKFFNCWNKFLEDYTTQAFIFCDKAKDASLIVVAFRGTEPFNANDWSTDFDFSRVYSAKMGGIHLGFLKALGLQNEKDYQKGFPEDDPSTEGKPLAYYAIRDELVELLKEHTNAKILVTGHSLGGALAILFPFILAMQDQSTILGSTYGVMTYGQPRVGDDTFGSYMESIALPGSKYCRMVYRYDLVPRVPPYVPIISPFEHFGICIYFDGWYKGQVVDEVPNPNYFKLSYLPSMHWYALVDLIKGPSLWVTQGKDFKEGWVSILYRAFGLIIPGIASHGPRDYVNAARLAKISNKLIV